MKSIEYTLSTARYRVGFHPDAFDRNHMYPLNMFISQRQ